MVCDTMKVHSFTFIVPDPQLTEKESGKVHAYYYLHKNLYSKRQFHNISQRYIIFQDMFY